MSNVDHSLPKFDMRRNPVYQVDCSALSSGKTFGLTKRRVTFRFGFACSEALAVGHVGSECRGEEHEINFSWSLFSGKRTIVADGQEVHFTQGNRSETVFEASWQMKGNHTLKILAHAFPAIFDSVGFHQFDLFLDGLSFFDMPRIFELGVVAGNAFTSRALAKVAPSFPSNFYTHDSMKFARVQDEPRYYSSTNRNLTLENGHQNVRSDYGQQDAHYNVQSDYRPQDAHYNVRSNYQLQNTHYNDRSGYRPQDAHYNVRPQNTHPDVRLQNALNAGPQSEHNVQKSFHNPDLISEPTRVLGTPGHFSAPMDLLEKPDHSTFAPYHSAHDEFTPVSPPEQSQSFDMIAGNIMSAYGPTQVNGTSALLALTNEPYNEQTPSAPVAGFFDAPVPSQHTRTAETEVQSCQLTMNSLCTNVTFTPEPKSDHEKALSSLVNFDDITVLAESPEAVKLAMKRKELAMMNGKSCPIPPVAPSWKLGTNPCLGELQTNSTAKPPPTKEVMRTHAFDPAAAQAGMLVQYGASHHHAPQEFGPGPFMVYARQ